MIAEILFFHLLITVLRWKNDVLRSPSLIQFTRAFWYQSNSSCSYITSKSLRSLASSFIRLEFRPRDCALWIPLIRAMSLRYLRKILWKISLFQVFKFSDNECNRGINGVSWLQSVWMKSLKFSWVSQAAWKRNGRLTSFRGEKPLEEIRRGQWSDCKAGKCFTLAVS